MSGIEFLIFEILLLHHQAAFDSPHTFFSLSHFLL